MLSPGVGVGSAGVAVGSLGVVGGYLCLLVLLGLLADGVQDCCGGLADAGGCVQEVLARLEEERIGLD